MNYFAYITPLTDSSLVIFLLESSAGLPLPDNILTQITLNYGCCQITQLKVQMITG